jgi:hypothetical protein
MTRRWGRCGATARKGRPCIAKAMKNGRCRNHGGMATGARTKAGKRRLSVNAAAAWARWRAERGLPPGWRYRTARRRCGSVISVARGIKSIARKTTPWRVAAPRRGPGATGFGACKPLRASRVIPPAG